MPSNLVPAFAEMSGWGGRFAREGLAGLEDRPHPGRAPKYDSATVRLLREKNAAVGPRRLMRVEEGGSLSANRSGEWWLT